MSEHPEAVLKALKTAAQRVGSLRGDPDRLDEYLPVLTGAQREWLIELVESDRPSMSMTGLFSSLTDEQKRAALSCEDDGLSGASYAQLADSATSFDPERQFDADRDAEEGIHV
jgi:hypothetical protein